MLNIKRNVNCVVMDLKGKTVYVISALKFLNLIETRHDSKKLENNSKLLIEIHWHF